MKKLIIKVLLLFASISTNIFIINSTPLTTNIARKMNFYNMKNDLRLKATQKLNQVEDQLNIVIQELRNKKRYRAADVMEEEFSRIADIYSQEIDAVFNYIDRRMVVGGHQLDDVNAPIEEKIKFIQGLRAEALVELGRIINKRLSHTLRWMYNY